jgi:hypothetical protein
MIKGPSVGIEFGSGVAAAVAAAATTNPALWIPTMAS